MSCGFELIQVYIPAISREIGRGTLKVLSLTTARILSFCEIGQSVEVLSVDTVVILGCGPCVAVVGV